MATIIRDLMHLSQSLVQNPSGKAIQGALSKQTLGRKDQMDMPSNVLYTIFHC